MKLIAFLSFTLLTFLACGASAEEPPDDTIAQEILEEQGYTAPEGNVEFTGEGILTSDGLIKAERLQRGNVEYYRVNHEALDLAPGVEYAEVYEVVTVNVRGEPMKYARAVPPDEVGRMKAEASGLSTEQYADGLRAYGSGLLAIGGVLQDEAANSPFGSLMTGSSGGYLKILEAGEKAGLDCFQTLRVIQSREQTLYEPDVQPWTSINPMTFMMGPACTVMFAADAFDGLNAIDPETLEEIQRAIRDARSQIKYVGTETVDDAPTHHVRAEGLNISETVDGKRTEINAMSIWIDARYFVRRKTRLEGVMDQDGESREFFMERLEQDYRNVPDSTLYEPYRQVLRVGGMMDAEQQAELEESEAQLEELERQMAGMPAGQRAMMERMVGDKIQQLRNLISGDALEFELVTASIDVNPNFADTALRAFAEDTDGGLTRAIQIDLTTLGYDPGNTDGDLTQETVAAIVQFEADSGMEITGNATPQLADALREAVEEA